MVGKTEVVPVEVFQRKLAVERAVRDSVPPGGFTKIPTTQGTAPQHKPASEMLPPTRKSNAQKRFEIESLLEKYNFHPIEEMILMFKGKRGAMDVNGELVPLTNDQRIKLLAELTSYVVPKVKSIEVSGNVDHSLTVNILKFADHQTLSSNQTAIEGRTLAPVQPLEEVTRRVDEPVEVEILREGAA